MKNKYNFKLLSLGILFTSLFVISCTSEDGDENIQLSEDSLLMHIGEESCIGVLLGVNDPNEVSQTDKNTTNYYWESSDEQVAIINEYGCITALSTGTTIITVTSKKGNSSAICDVTVEILTKAKYWKNGVPVDLSNGSVDSYATSIAVVGDDVHVCGYEQVAGESKAKYWKNGKSIDLANSNNAQAVSIAVSGTDVYIAGTYSGGVACWVNGNMKHISSREFSEANDIAVTDTCVYVVGRFVSNDRYYGALWKWKKNSSVIEYFIGNEYINHIVTGICVTESDLYVTAYAKYATGARSMHYRGEWMNYEVYISGYGGDYYTNAITVVGGNVYTAGYGLQSAIYWKNSTENILATNPNSIYQTRALGIAVSGNDVHVCGNAEDKAKYWFNGTTVNLTDGLGEATDIAISGTDVYISGWEFKE